MRNLTAVFVLSLVTLMGCNLLKKPDVDAGTDAAPVDTTALAADAAPEAAAGVPTGKNASQVARFGTETAVNQPLVIGQVIQPHTAPTGGTPVTTLHPGTAVTRIATNGVNQNLIVFPDPNVPTDSLMGWVPDAAFSTAVVAIHHDAGVVPVVPTTTVPTPTANIACPIGKVPILLPGGHPACHVSCTTDANCPHKACKDFTNPNTNAPVRACLND